MVFEIHFFVLSFILLLLLVSLFFNLFLAYHLKYKKVKVKPSLEVSQLLHDLTKGQSVVRITVLDPTELFYRSPKF